MRKQYLIIAIFLFSLSKVFYGQDIKIFTSNYPLSYFAERISGNQEIVTFPEIEGDPAFWEPDLDNIIAIQNLMELVTRNGL